MNVDAREKVTKDLQRSGFSVIWMSIVKKLNGITKPNVILAVTDRVLAVYDLKGSKRKMMESWLLLKQMFRKGEKMTLTWGHKKFTFNASNVAAVNTIIEVVQRILLSSELSKIGISVFDVPRSKPTAAGFIARLREEARLKGKELSTRFQNELFAKLVYSEPYVNISSLPDIDNLIDLFLISLPLSDTIVDISLKSTAKLDVFDVMSEFGKEPNDLKRIELIGPLTQAYQSFLANWKEGHPQLRAISFEGTDMGTQHLGPLLEMATAVKLKGIEFHSAIRSDSLLYFCSTFLNKPLLDNLVLLNLDHTKNLDFDLLLPRLNSLMMLSLADCDLEVSFALEKLSKFTRLRVLNLSNNPCRVVIKAMPTGLHELYLDSVKWSDQTLGRFIPLVAQLRLKLSLSMAVTSEAEWKAVITSFERCASSALRGFNWSRNPLTGALFNFLSLCETLESLTLCECFRESVIEPISWLREYLMNQSSLKRLVLRGSKMHCLGENVTTIINGVHMSRSQIDYLDISNNYCGDKGLNELRKLLLTERRYSIKTVIFDGMEPSNGFHLVDFLKEMIPIKETKLSFPQSDLMSLRQKGLVTNESFEELQKMLKRSIGSSEPFHIFHETSEETFPHLVTDEMIAELMRAPPVAPMSARQSTPYGAESLRYKPRPGVQAKDLFPLQQSRRSGQISNPVSRPQEPVRKPEPEPEPRTETETEPESTPKPKSKPKREPSPPREVVTPRTVGGSSDGYNLQDSYSMQGTEESVPGPEVIRKPQNDSDSYPPLDTTNDIVIPKKRRALKGRRIVAAKKTDTKQVCQITFGNSDSPEEGTPVKPTAKPRPNSVQRRGARSALGGRRSTSVRRVVRKVKTGNDEEGQQPASVKRKARYQSLELGAEERYQVAEKEEQEEKSPQRRVVSRRAASRQGTPKNRARRVVKKVVKQATDSEEAAPANKRSQSVQGKRRPQKADPKAMTSPNPRGNVRPSSVKAERRLSLSLSRRNINPKPNWQFPISTFFSFDDERIREAQRQFETQNMLEVLMNEQDWEPVQAVQRPKVIKRVVRKRSVPRRR